MYASLPGKFTSVQDDEWGTECDRHHDCEAVTRICVEADSFGAEYSNMCQECLDKYEAHQKQKKNDPSQWETCKCGTSEPSLISYRDYEEGMHGPVYQHCSKCHEKMNKRIAEEEDFYSQDDDYY